MVAVSVTVVDAPSASVSLKVIESPSAGSAPTAMSKRGGGPAFGAAVIAVPVTVAPARSSLKP